MFGDIILLEGGEVKSSKESFSSKGRGVEISFYANEALLHIRFRETKSCNGNITVNFRLKEDGNGYDGELTLKTVDGECIDYGFPLNIWNRVRFSLKLQTDENGSFVLFKIYGCKGKTIYISNITAEMSDDALLLGGVKLWQMECVGLMMGYVFLTPDGKVVVIDGGNSADTETLYRFLKTLSSKVDYWFLTHFHCDHISALCNILRARDIKIGTLYYDFPTTETVKECSSDSDAYLCDEFQRIVETNSEKIEKTVKPKRGDDIKISDALTIRVLNDACFDKSENYGNNTCVMYKAITPAESVLFTGDMGDRGDLYLQDEWFRNEIETCAVVQLAHHGSLGVSDEFYNTINNIKACLYPSAQWIYDNDNGQGFNSAWLNTLQTRALVRERGVLRIYKSMDGRKLIE